MLRLDRPARGRGRAGGRTDSCHPPVAALGPSCRPCSQEAPLIWATAGGVHFSKDKHTATKSDATALLCFPERVTLMGEQALETQAHFQRYCGDSTSRRKLRSHHHPLKIRVASRQYN